MRDALLVALEVALVFVGLAGVWVLAGFAAAVIAAAVIGILAVESRSR